MQAQLQVLIEIINAEAEVFQLNTGSNVKVAKFQTFDRAIGKVLGFLIAYKLYIRIRMREIVVKKQIQQVLLYMQEELANIQKKNILNNW